MNTRSSFCWAVVCGLSINAMAANGDGDNPHMRTPQYIVDKWDFDNIQESNRIWWKEQQAERAAEFDFWNGEPPPAQQPQTTQTEEE